MKVFIILLIVIFSSILNSIEIEEFKKCVTFIFSHRQANEISPRGTGFFVGVNSVSDSSKVFIYLVTSKHVLKDSLNNFLDKIYLRMNTNTGNSEIITMNLYDDYSIPKFVIPNDSSIDLIVIPYAPDFSKYDFKYIPTNMIASEELIVEKKIREGDDIFFCGLFINYFGSKKNYPIFRFGKVALMTDELIRFEGEYSKLYLLETTSFGGNSGSPVFFKLDPTRIPNQIVIGPEQIYLAGIMRGYFGALIDSTTIKTKGQTTVPLQNAGIAAVVPAY